MLLPTIGTPPTIVADFLLSFFHPPQLQGLFKLLALQTLKQASLVSVPGKRAPTTFCQVGTAPSHNIKK